MYERYKGRKYLEIIDKKIIGRNNMAKAKDEVNDRRKALEMAMKQIKKDFGEVL